jgi:Uma2 family endonuclease
MAEAARAMTVLTYEEYLELEERSDVKHEYVAGQIHAMSGVTKRHNVIAGNIFAELRAAARGTPCRLYVADVKLRAAADVVYYPDVMVACGPEEGGPLVEEAPCLVVEVTSPSTERIDRGEKLLVYRRMESLRAYWIVDQGARHVDRHWREADGIWRREMLGEGGDLPAPCPETRVPLATIYEGAGE